MPFQPFPTGGQQLRGVFQYLIDFGFQDFVLPALLIFTLFFAVLQRVPLFQTTKTVAVKDAQGKISYKEETYPAGHPEAGKPMRVGDRRINAIIAIVIALAITIPHTVGMYPADFDPIRIISNFLPSTVVVLVACLVVILLLGLAGAHIPSALQLLVAFVAVAFLIIIFLMNMFTGFFPTFYFLRDPAVQALIIVLLTMGLVGYWIIRPEKKEELPKTLSRWMMEKVTK